MTQRPHFDQLPLRKGDPRFSAWGLWGPDDKLGTLNLLTADTVRAAAGEIQSGERFSLNLPLEKPSTAGFGRHFHPYEHKLIQNPHILTLDDTLTFNTQKSSQWDGLRHFAYQAEQKFYNGVTLDEIQQVDNDMLGQQSWHDVGGIVGRGLLIDYWSWAKEHGKTFDASTAVAIRFDDLMACLEWQQEKSGQPDACVPRQGDILFVRVGYIKRYIELTPEEEVRTQSQLPPATCGVHQDVRMLEWLWDSQFAAVAGDAPGWECFPPDQDAGFMYHEILLAGWGCPIAELINLEHIAAHCSKVKRWTFFLSSIPLNVHGGVASPANMVAIM
ncbi:Hypothetical protein D9617_37g012320 [Elsinoe fawcettii]|nr:Hypothetical protein D9617_37g012320 [Elsinoe fawcettii]